jgi:hypothetical protein
MRRFFIIAVVLTLLAWGAVPCLGGDPAAMIQGKWNIAPNKRLTQGAIEFKANRTYVLKEKHHDKTWVTTKGQYNLQPALKPMRIDICLNRCGGPGSEWTTRFGIIRFQSADHAQIFTSRDKNYPSDFPSDTQNQYFMDLTRIK